MPIVLGLTGCLEFGDADAELRSVLVKNICGSPVVAELTQVDGTTLEGPYEIGNGIKTYLHIPSDVVKVQPAIQLILRADGQVIWVDDDVTMTKPAHQLVVSGVCGSNSVCEAVGQRIECVVTDTRTTP